jgi:hypothetical protein
VGQQANLIRNHLKATSLFADTGSFNRCVQGQKIRLIRSIFDDIYNGRNLLRVFTQPTI